jgi:hypothetical protein
MLFTLDNKAGRVNVGAFKRIVLLIVSAKRKEFISLPFSSAKFSI